MEFKRAQIWFAQLEQRVLKVGYELSGTEGRAPLLPVPYFPPGNRRRGESPRPPQGTRQLGPCPSGGGIII